MKYSFRILVLAGMLLATVCPAFTVAQEETPQAELRGREEALPQVETDREATDLPVVYVIPIEEMIERGLVYVIRRGVAEAVSQGADAIIFDMHTPGGRLDAAEEIINIIANIEIETYTFVRRNAISAGAIIALGTDYIYMAPGSRIGDAMPIMVSPMGGAQEMPEAMEEKAVSYVSSLVRSTAQRKNHDPQLAEAMVRRGTEYKIGDEVICPADQLLTLTNVEAERLVTRDGKEGPLLSSGTVKDIDALLEIMGRPNAEVRRLTITPAEKIARYIEMLSALLLIGGVLGLYIEFKTPGFGVPGIAGIVLLAIWFWGHNVAGLAGMGELVLFALGVILLLVEIFLIPGFGFVGATGIFMIVLSLVMAMVQHYPGVPFYRLPEVQIGHAMRTAGMALVGAFAFGLLLARFLPKVPAFHGLMLKTEETRDAGFTAAASLDDLVGSKGVSETPLRPAGIGTFGDKRLNVITRGEFVDHGVPIVIAETHGNRIVVERVDECGS